MANQPPDWLHFWQRPFPSANTLLIEDEKPVLIDSGFGRDVPALLRWLQRSAVAPERLWLLVNTILSWAPSRWRRCFIPGPLTI